MSFSVRVVDSPAATTEHMTKNMPTAILFRGEGSRPLRLRMGSTTLSLRGINMRINTASNMVSQAAGKRKVFWEQQGNTMSRVYKTLEDEQTGSRLCAGQSNYSGASFFSICPPLRK